MMDRPLTIMKMCLDCNTEYNPDKVDGGHEATCFKCGSYNVRTNRY